MHPPHRLGMVEIGQSARDPKRAIEPSGRELRAVCRLAQQRVATGVKLHHLFELLNRAIGVGADGLNSEGGVAFGLDLPGLPRRARALSSDGTGFTRSAALTAGTSICISMRSSRGPEMRDWYRSAQFWPRPHENPGSPARPQRHGFMAAISWMREG